MKRTWLYLILLGVWLTACRPAEPLNPTLAPASATTTAVLATPAPPPANTPQATLCPQATPELLSVEPLLGRTDRLSQTIAVSLGNSEAITITAESGVFTGRQGQIEISLLPDTIHHLTVEGRVRPVTSNGCQYGGYTLSTTTDRTGARLIIEHSSDLAAAPPAVLQGGLTQVDQIGGISLAVAVAGATAYLGSGQRVLAVDVSNPEAPQVIGRSPLLPGLVREIEIANGHAYILAGDSALYALDVSDPATLPVRAVFPVPGVAIRLVSQDERLFLAADHFRAGPGKGIFLLALDISRPDQIREMGRLDLLPPPLTTVQSVVMSQGYVYLSGSKEVFVVDVADPAALRLVNQFDAYLADMATAADRGYLVGWQGLTMLDLSEPARPVAAYHLSALDGSTNFQEWRGGPSWVALDGDNAIMADWGITGCNDMCRSVVWAMDVTADAPEPVPVLELDVGATDVAFSAGWVYVAHREGLQLVDVRQPLAARRAGAVDTAVNLTSLPDGRYAYISPVIPSDGFQFDPADPAELKALLTLNEWWAATLIGDYLYVGEVGAALTVYDGRDLTALTQVATVAGEAFDFAVGDHYLFTRGRSEINAIDISTPAAPRLVTTIEGLGRINALATAQNYAYVATQGLIVMDMNNPALAGVLDSPAWVTTQEMHDLEVVGDFLYMGMSKCHPSPPNCDVGSLWLADISSPAAPEMMTQFPITGGVAKLAVADEAVYLVTRLAELWLVDRRDPARPVVVGQIRLPSPGFYQMAFANGRLYLYDRNTGWLVYQPDS